MELSHVYKLSHSSCLKREGTRRRDKEMAINYKVKRVRFFDLIVWHVFVIIIWIKVIVVVVCPKRILSDLHGENE